MARPFLTAEWQNLIVFTYEIDPAFLKSHIPQGVSLLTFEGKTFISIVGFTFAKMKLFGVLPLPKLSSFEEVNLRCYVERERQDKIRKGITFIKEIVPSHLVSFGAKTFYNEPYETFEMSSSQSPTVGYFIHCKGSKAGFSVTINNDERSLVPQTLEYFILENYFGYSTQRDGSTMEYKVTHEPWLAEHIKDWNITSEVWELYGEIGAYLKNRSPTSVLFSKGSPVAVSKGERVISDPEGWVLYDGLCGFCSWWIPFWRKTINQAGFDICPVQDPWVKTKLGFSESELNNDIRLLLKDGTLINGADAYIFGMKKVWWSLPIGILLGLPGMRTLTWLCYKAFNRNRFLVSKICRMPSEL